MEEELEPNRSFISNGSQPNRSSRNIFLEQSFDKSSDARLPRPRYELFPTSLRPGVEFSDLTQLKLYLKHAAEDKDNFDLSELYTIKCLPNTTEARIIRAKCSVKECQSIINLNFVGNTIGYFVVTSMDNQHYHPLTEFRMKSAPKPRKQSQFKTKTKRQQKKTNRPQDSRDKPKRPATLSKLKNEPSVGEMRLFSCFTTFIDSRGYKFICSRDYEPAVDAYPHVAVCASGGMRRNYKKFSDIVYFDFFEEAISGFEETETAKVFHLATFATADTNNRPIFLGFALLTLNSPEALYWAWELFIKLHERPPRVVSLNHNSSNIQAMRYLQLGELFTGTVIYRVRDFMQQLRRTMRGDKSVIKSSLETFKLLVDTTSKQTYAECLDKLTNDFANSNLFKSVMPIFQNICMLDIPKKFIGLRRNNLAEKLYGVISEELSLQPNVIQAFRRLELLDKKFNRRSNGALELFQSEIEEAFKDTKIKNVRVAFEKRVFQRFLENYIEGIEHYTCVREPNKRIAFTVMSRYGNSEEEFQVDEWECSCQEGLKTGIPCPHLLISARNVPDKGYISFFAGRWRRQPPPVKSTNRKALGEQQVPKRIQSSSKE